MRDIEEIRQSMGASNPIEGASTSEAADHKLWVEIFAEAVHTFEGILDLTKEGINASVSQKHWGTEEWLREKALEFQGGGETGTFLGDELISENGIIKYKAIDESRRIISVVAIASNSGQVAIKAAKAGASGYEALSTEELAAFTIYMKKRKIPGQTMVIASGAPVIIMYALTVHHSKNYPPAEAFRNAEAKIEEYRLTLGFDATVYNQRFVSKILEAEGVETVTLQSFQKSAGNEPLTNIVDKHTLESGYFNYDPASTITIQEA